jgi:hypothetical protein
MKDAGLRIRIEPELRDAFIRTCHESHTPAAQVLRAFMRDYVNQAQKQSRTLNRASFPHSNQPKQMVKDKSKVIGAKID